MKTLFASLILLAAAILPLSAQPEQDDGAKFLNMLVGKWYCFGNANKECYITTMGKEFFIVNEWDGVWKISVFPNQMLLGTNSSSTVAAKVTEDIILWKGGGWWKRELVAFPEGK